MYDKEHIDLALYRMEKAEETLTDAKDALRMGKFANAANRSYYAFFHAVRALFALEAKDFRKHSGVIAGFQKDYIKTGVFPVEMGKQLQSAFNLRTQSDYRDFYVLTKEKVAAQVANAETFVETLKGRLLSMIAQE